MSSSSGMSIWVDFVRLSEEEQAEAEEDHSNNNNNYNNYNNNYNYDNNYNNINSYTRNDGSDWNLGGNDDDDADDDDDASLQPVVFMSHPVVDEEAPPQREAAAAATTAPPDAMREERRSRMMMMHNNQHVTAATITTPTATTTENGQPVDKNDSPIQQTFSASSTSSSSLSPHHRSKNPNDDNDKNKDNSNRREVSVATQNSTSSASSPLSLVEKNTEDSNDNSSRDKHTPDKNTLDNNNNDTTVAVVPSPPPSSVEGSSTSLPRTSSNHSRGTLQTVQFAEDIEDEIDQHHQKLQEQLRRRFPDVGKYHRPRHASFSLMYEAEQQIHNNNDQAAAADTTTKMGTEDDAATPNSSTNTMVVVYQVTWVWKIIALVGVVLGLCGTGLAGWCLVRTDYLTRNNNDNDNDYYNDDNHNNNNIFHKKNPTGAGVCTLGLNGQPVCSSTASATPSLLETVYERGSLRCGFPAEERGFLSSQQGGIFDFSDNNNDEPLYVGMDVDLCRAVAAALFDGDTEAFQPHVVVSSAERFVPLNSTDIDILFRTTHTMEREIHEATTGQSYAFGSPYFYDGVSFGGLAEFVECLEKGIFNGTCADLRICVLGTNEAVVERLVPSAHLVVEQSERAYYGSFPTVCNVIAGERLSIDEQRLRQQGFQGDYAVRTGLNSREPLCMVTRRGDPRWTDFVEAVLQSLLYAEEEGITQVTSVFMPTTTLFGPRFEKMFQHAVAAGGNYGEIYVQNLEAYMPRESGMNRLNFGDEPRIWSFPFGNLAAEGKSLEMLSPTVKAIKARGFLGCGQGIVLGLSEFDAAAREYKGFQVDLCSALSAALFDGVDHTVFTTFFFPRRYDVMNQGPVDVLFSTSNNLQRNTFVSTLGQGMSFSATYHYLGITFGGIPVFVDCAIRLDTFSPECQSLRVCVRAGTATVKRFSEVARENYLVPLDSFPEMYRALRDGRCNTILAGSIQIQEPRVRAQGYGYDGPYELAKRFFSIEHLAIATRDEDPVWSSFVAWVYNSLVYAEENGIHQATAALMPKTNLWGPLRTDAFYHAVNMVGNFGEIYERNLGTRLPRQGIHQLNNNTQPRLYSIPGVRV